MKNRNLIIIVSIVFILLIGIGIWAYVQSNKQTVVLPTPVNGTTQPTDIFSGIVGLFQRLFKKSEPLPPFVQTLPIDADGCDANGYNRIGIRCL